MFQHNTTFLFSLRTIRFTNRQNHIITDSGALDEIYLYRNDW